MSRTVVKILSCLARSQEICMLKTIEKNKIYMETVWEMKSIVCIHCISN